MFKRIKNIVFNFFRKNHSESNKEQDNTENLDDRNKLLQRKIDFQTVISLERTPNNDQVREHEFLEIVYKDIPMWVMFKCPCGCGFVISLSLQKVHNPKWSLTQNSAGYPTLYPSIWRDTDCYSHFWITDGKVVWCGDNGIEPWIAEPNKYNKCRVI